MVNDEFLQTVGDLRPELKSLSIKVKQGDSNEVTGLVFPH